MTRVSENSRVFYDVIVVGGGPAGMMAAVCAGERGKSVLLLEKNPKLGKKLLITGGGRCNVTNNTPDIRALLSKYKGSDQFLFSAFSQYSVPEALSFFNERGMATKEEAEGRMFPVSNKAESVWKVLEEAMKKAGVVVRTSVEVKGIRSEASGHMAVILADKTEMHGKTCIVATGGTSRPETGSTGDGFKWLKKLGHTIVANDVALVPIKLKDAWVKKVAGVALQNIKLTIYKDGVKQKAHKGKVLFTHVGISGPTVLNMSKEIGELLSGEGSEYVDGKNEDGVKVVLDAFPTLDGGKLKEKIQTLLTEQSNKKIKNSLSPFIPSALVDPILMLAGIDGETPCHSVRTEERKALVSLLKAIPLHVEGLLGKDKAIVSSGGVALSEVNFKTMQSRIIPQLFLVGDVLNINRPSGGYSLQLCWTTGYVAGNNC